MNMMNQHSYSNGHSNGYSNGHNHGGCEDEFDYSYDEAYDHRHGLDQDAGFQETPDFCPGGAAAASTQRPPSSGVSLDDCEDHLAVMLRQEASPAYRNSDFLMKVRPVEGDGDEDAHLACPLMDIEEPQALQVHRLWRQTICEWWYQVVDHFDMNREVVTISMDFLDRVVAGYEEPLQKDHYQLLSLTCLYMAMKLFDYPHFIHLARSSSSASSSVITRHSCMERMLRLSRGDFTVEHMEQMEVVILGKLNWHVHPPTPQTFLYYMVPILFSRHVFHPDDVHAIADLAKFVIELATLDAFFLPYTQSEITMAALLNAADHMIPMGSKYILSLWKTTDQQSVLVGGINVFSRAIALCRERLSQVYECTMSTPSATATMEDEHAGHAQTAQPCSRYAETSSTSESQQNHHRHHEQQQYPANEQPKQISPTHVAAFGDSQASTSMNTASAVNSSSYHRRHPSSLAMTANAQALIDNYRQ